MNSKVNLINAIFSAETYRRFWFLRGVVAAFTTMSLVPNFTNLSQYQFLRAFHAVVWGWNECMAWLGQKLGLLPFIPELPAFIVNSILLFSSLVLPTAYLVSTRYTGFYNRLVGFLSVLPVGVTLILLVVLKEFADAWFGLPLFAQILLTLASFILVLMYFAMAIIQSPSFGRALVFSFMFVVSLEALYLLKAPWFSDAVDQFACERLDFSPTDCREN